MKRREFIWTGLAALGATAVGVLTLDFLQVCRAMVLEDIVPIRIRRDSVDQFIEEADKECFWERFTLPKRMYVIVQHGLLALGIRLPYFHKYLQTRDLVTGTFLMSTDLFFSNFSNREINYISYHNPYKLSCSNPFSSLWVSEATISGGWNSVTTTARRAVARQHR
jgi:hypothetical protein